MSTQAAAQFLGNLANDQELRSKLSVKNKSRDERLTAAVELGKKRGFEFTAEECETILATAQKVQDGELTDAELETVAGGSWLDDLGRSLHVALVSIFGIEDSFDDDDDDDDDDGSGNTAIAGVRG